MTTTLPRSKPNPRLARCYATSTALFTDRRLCHNTHNTEFEFHRTSREHYYHMSIILAIAGSISQSYALLCGIDGEFLAFERLPGIHLRETSEASLKSYFERVPALCAKNAKLSVSRLFKRCSQVSIALSGSDHRFDQGLFLGNLRNLGFKLEEDQFAVHGYSEAVFRAILGERPGIVIRAGAGFSVFGVNSTGERQIASALTTIMGAPGSAYTLGLNIFHIVNKVFDNVASSEEQAICDAALIFQGV